MEENRFYGFSQKRIIRIVMCGGCKEWWNYVLEFKQGYDNLNGYKLYREDSDGIKVKVYDEILEKNCDDCETDDDSTDISEMLKNSGLETSDDHVERLADDLRNKRGGQA